MKQKSFFSAKRNIVICAAIFVVIIAVVCLFVFGNSTRRKKVELENNLASLGKDFYENFYYDLVVRDNGIQTITKFKTIGIKISLDNIIRYKEENADLAEKFVNPDTKEACDKTNTKAIIYPKEPYGKTDYTIEVE